jgi:hypothetical protein
MDRPQDYGRRDFLRAGAALGLTLGLPPVAHADTEPRIRKRVTLGRTGVELPDIGFGTFALEGDASLIEHALERGITHFDTAESYTGGSAEQTLGRALANRRDAVTLTTKTLAEADDSVAVLMGRLEASLKRLGTDRIDFYLNHAVDDVARLRNPEWSEFVARAKAQGKIRFAGMSGHGPSLVTCLNEALDREMLDVVLVAYNYIQSPDFIDTASVWVQQWLGTLDWVALQPELPRVLARAKAAGLGVMTMKTLRGARHNDMRAFETPGSTFSQAALRWVLSDQRVDSAVVSMTSKAMIDEYVGASGFDGPRSSDLALLSRYEHRNRQSQCIQGCGDCLPACPSGVSIPDVLRIGMYDRDYGQPSVAAGEYAALAGSAAACAGCATTPCVGVCTTGIPIAEMAREIHRRLG